MDGGDRVRKPKIERGETWSEAQAFTWRNNQYLRAGLCPRCAAQAAYGHQHGWRAVHPPCDACAAIVGSFPKWTSVDAWRALGREGAGEGMRDALESCPQGSQVSLEGSGATAASNPGCAGAA